MDLPNPKELKALLKVCRDFGVDSVEVGELRVKFGDMPRSASDTETVAHVGAPSDEDLAYWSSAPDPLAQRLGEQ